MSKQTTICSTCGMIGPSKSHTPGSVWIELLLWFCFFVPGLIYSIWRLTSRKRVCGHCLSPELVPISTPRGRELQAKYHS